MWLILYVSLTGHGIQEPRYSKSQKYKLKQEGWSTYNYQHGEGSKVKSYEILARTWANSLWE